MSIDSIRITTFCMRYSNRNWSFILFSFYWFFAYEKRSSLQIANCEQCTYADLRAKFFLCNESIYFLPVSTFPFNTVSLFYDWLNLYDSISFRIKWLQRVKCWFRFANVVANEGKWFKFKIELINIVVSIIRNVEKIPIRALIK